MTELLSGLLQGWQLQSGIELFATLLALSYTLLAIKHSLWCWPAALLSTLLTLHIMVQSQLFTDALLQLYYAGMAIYGWLNWRRMTAQSHGVPETVVEWHWLRHVQLIAWHCGSRRVARLSDGDLYQHRFCLFGRSNQLFCRCQYLAGGEKSGVKLVVLVCD